MISKTRFRRTWLACFIFCLAAASLMAAYKARPWTIKAPESYPARLTSEGITIAVEPCYSDALAGAIFDKSDIVTRGIIPLAVVIFNENDFPITVESASIEVISGDDHVHTQTPEETVARVFAKSSSKSLIPQPLPKISVDKGNSAALDDFAQKFLAAKTVEPHSKGGGFLYLRLPSGSKTLQYLGDGRVYIPEVYRQDTGTKMIFFEIDLKPAVTPPGK